MSDRSEAAATAADEAPREENHFPDKLPVMPLKNGVLFPLQLMPLVVGRPRSVAAVEAALGSEDKAMIVVAQRDDTNDAPGADDLYPLGTMAILKRVERAQNVIQALVAGTRRVELTHVEQQESYLMAHYRELPPPTDDGTEVEALDRAVVELAGRALEIVQPEGAAAWQKLVSDVKEPLHRVYLLASLLSLDVKKGQSLLVADTTLSALRLMHEYLSHEVQVLELRHKIASQAHTELSKQQREYVLRQQMKAIQDELGETSPEEADTAELRQRVLEAELPEKVRQEVDKELQRLERMPPAAADYQVIRSYVELILELPWGAATEDILDLPRARQVLDEDHFDLDEVKDRIIEHLAVMKLNPQASSPILCFLGPPGVGKTSLGQSIARALGRKFERMSLGGMHDESELRGHRRTYIGAMPGRIIQSMRRAGVHNPLLMLDEIDKLGRDFRGDPSSALMEILDPAQNATFQDNYLNMPFDLSHVFFIATCNTLDPIPRPLLDRMEVLRLPGYSDREKCEIARRYLIQQQLDHAGLTPEQLSFSDQALMHVIRRYTREAGVRELTRRLERIARKVATRCANGDTSPVVVSVDVAREMLGPERFFEGQARDALPSGVAAGLAWTEAGGDVLYVEAVLLPGGSELTLTGQLGNVMQESAKAAQSYIRSQAAQLGLVPQKIRESGVHIHVPSGAIPKDGPSAGVTITTALASLYGNAPVRADTAMTGEITLSGLVLPVGGVKEKVLAAHRAGFTRIILPKENEKDVPDIPEHVRQALEFVFTERIPDVLAAAIPKLVGASAKDQQR